MDGMKVALGNKGMILEAVRQCSKDRKEWRALVHMQLQFLLGTVISDRPPVSGGYHMERGKMPLHDAVGINCKNGASAEN